MDKEELQKRLDEISRNWGFDYAKYIGEYNGEQIYKPDFDEEGDVIFGWPVYLHVKGDKIRASKNHKEVSKVMHHFFPDGVD